MKIIPITLRQANKFVADNHRHNKPVQGAKFAIGCVEGDKLIGVAIAGRPVARRLDDGKTLEITRVCTDGTKNCNSFLYAACKRIAKNMGYSSCITYTLKSESGISLKAVGGVPFDCVKHGGWSNNVRQREDQAVFYEPKIRWELLS